MDKQVHYFVYYRRDGRYFYERTCGAERAAMDRVRELIARGYKALYQTDTIEGAFY